VLAVPLAISDNVLKHTASFRSRARIPALVYVHPMNNCTITRSAQPVVGLRGARSPQDEKLVAAIFETTRASLKLNVSATATPQNSRSTSDLTNMSEDVAAEVEGSTIGTASIEESTDIISTSQVSAESDGSAGVKIYGAQQNNLIVDARPTVNAIAMHVAGFGSENMDYYRTATKAYLGIDNIHVMRKSLEIVVEAFKDSDLTAFPPNREKLADSKWLRHISGILDGASLIASTIAINHSHVLIHCSDGWDRTSQLSALSQLCLDPFYRTIEGFIVLVEKDWLSFGYMFRLRSGILSHDKWFEIENERISATRNNLNGGSGADSPESGNAFENALASAKGLLSFRKKNDIKEFDGDSDGDIPSLDSSPAGPKRNLSAAAKSKENTMDTLLKETSPVFHQFLDATYQLLRQHPTRFEFNERFLRRLYYHLYSCQYGTFLYNNEKERVDMKAKERTRSVWDYFLAKRKQFLNENYDAIVDDHIPGKECLMLPRKDDVRWWAELFGRTDAEMNGPLPGATAPTEIFDGAIVTGLETSEGAITIDESTTFGTVSSISSGTGSGSTDRFARMEERPAQPVPDSNLHSVEVTLANVGLDKSASSAPPASRWTDGSNGKTTIAEMDVEML
jgi:myotubularin-related protein 6/7/8